MKINISTSRRKILNFLIQNANEGSLPPTLRELCVMSGLRSTWSVRYHLHKLEDEGIVRINKSKARGIELLKPAGRGIPIIGRISAGTGVDAVADIEGYADFSEMFDKTEEMIALRVSGDSMTGAGIFDGDLVFIHRQPDAASGQIVVAIVEDEAVVKRIRIHGKVVKLVSENPNYKPIIINGTDDFKILGKVVGVVRQYQS